ncbi:MAG: hypothetical protein M1829_002992 [Trizodia sp. TS-e1964]|nr:MAG: hypothetical protein M1829_002992 [Trizodia sp. TS-e1964]
MSLADYLAKNYLTADPPLEKKKKKGKRKASSGLVIEDDDFLGWNQSSHNAEDDEAPMTVGGNSAEFRKSKKSAWKVVGARAPPDTEQAAADLILASAAAESSARAALDADDDSPAIRMESGAHAGLQTAAQVAAQFAQRAAAERAAFARDDAAHTGKDSQTIYRDASGRIINIAMKRAEARRQAAEAAQAAAAEREAQKGAVQLAASAARHQQLRDAKYLPLARGADDAELNEELRAEQRWNDPAAAFLAKKGGAGKSASGRPVYGGAAMPNRYGIRPGYRWDGVDRGNGFEAEWFKARNRRENLKNLDYAWQMDE